MVSSAETSAGARLGMAISGCGIAHVFRSGRGKLRAVPCWPIFAPATDVMTLQRLMRTQRPPYLANARDRASIAAAVRAGARVFLSGQNALRADGRVDGPGDPAAQTNAALDRIEVALSAAGGSLKDITKLTTCIVDRDHRKAVYEAIGRRLPAVFPVSTGLVAAGLPLPDMMVQIDAEAVIPAPGANPVRRLR